MNLDTECLHEALRRWNVKHSGFDNPAAHLKWDQLSQAERSEVMRLAQDVKQERTTVGGVNTGCPS